MKLGIYKIFTSIWDMDDDTLKEFMGHFFDMNFPIDIRRIAYDENAETILILPTSEKFVNSIHT